MRVAVIFSDIGIGVICGGLMVTTLAGAEPAGDALSGISAAAKAAAEAATLAPAPGVAPPAASPPAPAEARAAGLPAPSPVARSEPAPVAAAVSAQSSPDQPPAADVVAKPSPGAASLKPAKVLFGAVKEPSKQAARAIGGYAKGCLAGAQALPVDGPAWQVMRLSRNRNWGHPKLIALVEKLAAEAKAKDGWSGLLVGDLSQPRGGPMASGHASHQIGLDADVWLTPMPDRTLTREERETLAAQSVLSDDSLSVVREKWSDAHTNLIRRAASYPEVERVLVHPAIKQVLCYAASGERGWLSKVRPYWGHEEHIHIRIGCPPGSGDCHAQPPPPGEDGCGKELDDWLRRVENLKQPAPPVPLPPIIAAKPAAPKEKPGVTLLDLPDACQPVLAQDNPDAAEDIADALKVEKGGRATAVAEGDKADKSDKAKGDHDKTASAAKLGGPKPTAVGPSPHTGHAAGTDKTHGTEPVTTKN